MARVFSNDPTAFLSVAHPVEAWNEMLSMEEKAVFREIMAILSSNGTGERRGERLRKEVILSLDFEFTRIVQTLRRMPTSGQLARINQRLGEYEAFLGDCIFKMHSQLNEFSPEMVHEGEAVGSLEHPGSLQTHTRLKSFEELLMQKIANLSQQIRKLGSSFVELEKISHRQKPFWQRWVIRLLCPFFNTPLALNRELMARLDELHHNLVQDYARLGTLWRYFNQHECLRGIEVQMQVSILEFCRNAYWIEFKGGWSRQTLSDYTESMLPTLRSYEQQLKKCWEQISGVKANALRGGLEHHLDDFQLELQDLIITLGKYKEAFVALFGDESADSPLCQEIEQISRNLHGMSQEAHRYRAQIYPVLSELNRESKENVLAFASWIDELGTHLEDEDRFKEDLGILFDSLKTYMDALVDSTKQLMSRVTTEAQAVEDLEPRQQEKFKTYKSEVTELVEVVDAFRQRYEDVLLAKQPELQGPSYHSVHLSQLEQMRKRLRGIGAKLQLPKSP